jgi:hypothetical protein
VIDDLGGAMLSRPQAGEHAPSNSNHGDPACAVTPCHPPSRSGCDNSGSNILALALAGRRWHTESRHK